MGVWVDHCGSMQDFFDANSLIYVVGSSLRTPVNMPLRATVDCRRGANPKNVKGLKVEGLTLVESKRECRKE